MEHNRKLLVGVVSLVLGNVRNGIKAMSVVRDEIEPLLIKSEWFNETSFKHISLIIYYGNKTDLKVQFERIKKKYGELPISIELEMERIRIADKNKDNLVVLFRNAILEALLQVAEKYNLAKQELEAHRNSMITSLKTARF